MKQSIIQIKIHELASLEFDEAIDWYNMQSSGLGFKFKDAVICQINKVKTNPSWFLKETEKIYKAYIPKYPYKLLFTIEEDKIIIWAVAHLHRKPFYWQYRNF